MDTIEPNISKPFTGENRGEEAPADSFQRIEWHRNRYNNPFQRFGDKPYVRNAEPNSATRYSIAGNGTVVFGAGGEFLSFAVDAYEPALRLDPKTRQMKEHRVRHVGISSEGEKIFPAFSIDAWKFALEYHPDESWMTGDEYARILKEMAPILEQDRGLSDNERGIIDVRNRQLGQAAASRINPEAALAQGIAAGVAAALKNLGLTTKKG